jgi:putative tricarboxylic transport membrane protein
MAPDAACDAYVAAYETPEFAELQRSKGLLPLNKAGNAFQEDAMRRVENLREIAREAGLIE